MNDDGVALPRAIEGGSMTEQEKADRLLELEAGIIEEHHGSFYHVNGRYYANLDDAARQRWLAAERFLRDELRLEGVCAWCNIAFEEGEKRVRAAGQFIYPKPCADHFNAFCTNVGGVELPPDEVRAIAEWENGPTDADLDEVFTRFEEVV